MKPFLLDTTLRDGSYVLKFQFTQEQVSKIAGCLGNAGVDFIEVSHGAGVGAGALPGLAAGHSDAVYVETVRSALHGLASKVGVFTVPPMTTGEHMQPLWPLIDFVRVGVIADQPQAAFDLAAEVKRQGKTLFIQLMRASNLPLEKLKALAVKFAEISPDAIYVVDTTGSYQPTELRHVVKTLSQTVPIPLGFHGHDHLGLAFANSAVALQSGVKFVDGCLAGMGKGPGNAKTEDLAIWLNENCERTFDGQALKTGAESVVKPLLVRTDGKAREVYDLSARFRLDLPVDLIAAIEAATCSKPLEIFTTFKNLPNFFNINEASITQVVHHLLAQRGRNQA